MDTGCEASPSKRQRFFPSRKTYNGKFLPFLRLSFFASITVSHIWADTNSKTTFKVVGPVGSGKSTLLKGLLGEVPHTHGSINLPSRSIAFCDQTPWIANSTLKENITLFSGADEDYYESVLAACALHDDLSQIPDGDRSRVGSKGITLSGGQKQRLVCIEEERRKKMYAFEVMII